jgi:hypothetical protein
MGILLVPLKFVAAPFVSRFASFGELQPFQLKFVSFLLRDAQLHFATTLPRSVSRDGRHGPEDQIFDAFYRWIQEENPPRQSANEKEEDARYQLEDRHPSKNEEK